MARLVSPVLEISFEEPGAAASAESPRVVVIAAGQVTTLNVRVSSATVTDAQVAALDLAPSADLALASR